MNPRELWESINWNRVAKALLSNALERTGWLLVHSGRIEKACGEKLQELSARLKPD
jgi:hypothetical protein